MNTISGVCSQVIEYLVGNSSINELIILAFYNTDYLIELEDIGFNIKQIQREIIAGMKLEGYKLDMDYATEELIRMWNE